jgi:hypothetical protein
MEQLTHFLAKILSPILVPASHWLLSEKRKHPTWHFETAVVALVLFATALCTSPNPSTIFEHREMLKEFLIIWLSAFAVLGTFLHAKVGYRMAEALQAQDAPDTSCYDYSARYWLWKEILWLAVFILSGAYPAITGVIIFILYPAWREIHTRERVIVRG